MQMLVELFQGLGIYYVRPFEPHFVAVREKGVSFTMSDCHV